MKQPLVIELSDDAYAAIERRAAGVGMTPESMAAASLEQQFGRSSTELRAGSQSRAESGRLEDQFGAVDLGHATGADNAAIDADLARAYAETHEAS